MRAVVGLGSNLGDRLGALRAAVDRIPGVAARSRIWETAPVGGPPQDAFLNAAVLVETSLTPRALLVALQAIEAELGRERSERWGPRVIDLDVLWIEGVTIDEPDFVVPHPRLSERAFAVLPLLDVVPDAAYVAPPGDVRLTSLGWLSDERQ